MIAQSTLPTFATSKKITVLDHIPPPCATRYRRLYYQGLSTTVPVPILGQERLPPGRRIKLQQKRGWRTGLMGWNVGSVLGGKLGKILDVTPKWLCSWHIEIPDKKRRKIEKDIVECMSQLSVPVGHSVLETDFIQALSPDGYHRLAVYASVFSSTALACISAFRPASLGASVAWPRGASPITVILEMTVANGTGKVLDVTQSAIQATGSTVQKVQMISAGKTVTKYMARKGMNTSVNNEDGMVYNPDLTRRSPQRYDLADMRVFPASEGRNSDGRVSFA